MGLGLQAIECGAMRKILAPMVIIWPVSPVFQGADKTHQHLVEARRDKVVEDLFSLRCNGFQCSVQLIYESHRQCCHPLRSLFLPRLHKPAPLVFRRYLAS